VYGIKTRFHLTIAPKQIHMVLADPTHSSPQLVYDANGAGSDAHISAVAIEIRARAACWDAEVGRANGEQTLIRGMQMSRW